MNSISQISREISSAKETVKRHLLLWDIKLRPSDNKQRLNKGQVGFGERRIKAHIEQNKRELAVVEKMKALRSQGYSYWKIAEILNSMKVPTKSRKAKWKAATVMKILKRTGAF
ncbi:MAG: recombinase family protein [Deltaproteobacteria bacterium]|nr:recombinase family protein [Deltaproteobacteria bacterium]